MQRRMMRIIGGERRVLHTAQMHVSRIECFLGAAEGGYSASAKAAFFPF